MTARDAKSTAGEKRMKRCPAIEEDFLQGLRDGLTVTDAAALAGISAPGVYVWRKKSPEFRKAWDEAYSTGADTLFRAARKRAVDGVENMVLHQGVPVIFDGKLVIEKKYSDSLLMFLMSARDPFTYCSAARKLKLEKAMAAAEARKAAKLLTNAPEARQEALDAVAELDRLAAEKAALALEEAGE